MKNSAIATVVATLAALNNEDHALSTLSTNNERIAVMVLSQHEAGMSMGDLAGALGLSRAALTALTDRMEDAGMVTRTASPTDRRTILLTLTVAGVKALNIEPEVKATVKKSNTKKAAAKKPAAKKTVAKKNDKKVAATA